MTGPIVGIMKGVILGKNPRARILDLTHDLPPQDIRAGAPLAIMGSLGFLELSIRGGSFADRFKAKRGDMVICR